MFLNADISGFFHILVLIMMVMVSMCGCQWWTTRSVVCLVHHHAAPLKDLVFLTYLLTCWLIALTTIRPYFMFIVDCFINVLKFYGDRGTYGCHFLQACHSLGQTVFRIKIIGVYVVLLSVKCCYCSMVYTVIVFINNVDRTHRKKSVH